MGIDYEVILVVGWEIEREDLMKGLKALNKIWFEEAQAEYRAEVFAAEGVKLEKKETEENEEEEIDQDKLWNLIEEFEKRTDLKIRVASPYYDSPYEDRYYYIAYMSDGGDNACSSDLPDPNEDRFKDAVDFVKEHFETVESEIGIYSSLHVT